MNDEMVAPLINNIPFPPLAPIFSLIEPVNPLIVIGCNTPIVIEPITHYTCQSKRVSSFIHITQLYECMAA